MADRTVSVKLKAEVSDYMRKMREAGKATSDLERASKELQIAFDNEEAASGKVRIAQAKLNEVRASGKATASQLAVAEERLADATRSHARARENAIVAGERYIQLQKETETEVDRSADAIERSGRATEKVAKRANIQWRLLVGALSVGAPAASAAALGVAVAGVGAAFVGLGAVALRNNEAVRSSVIDLGQELKTGLAADAAVMETELVGAADMVGSRYQELRPQIQQAFAGSAQFVEPLTDGVLDLAENALPGMLNMINRGGPAVDGFGQLLARTGTGLSNLFDAAAENSEAAGQGLEHLGALVEGTLTSTGSLLGVLTQLWAEHGDEVAEVVTQIISVLAELTGSALPGLSGIAGSTLQILSSLLSVLEPMAPVRGPIIAAWLTFRTVLGGYNAVAKGATAAVGALSTGLGVAGIAFAAISTAAQLIQGPSEASTVSIEGLTSALERFARTGQITGEMSKLTAGNLGGLDQALNMVAEGGFNRAALETQTFIAGLVGIDTELAIAEESVGKLDQALAQMAASSPREAKQALEQLRQQSGMTRQEFAVFAQENLPQYTAAADAAAQKSRDLGTSAMQSVPGVGELEESLNTLADQTADTADKADALNDAWRRLFGIALTMEEAQAAFEGGLDDIAASLQEVQDETANWQAQLLNSNGTVNLSTEVGRQLSEQLIQQGEDYRTLAQTAYDTALQQGKSQQEATAAAVAATRQRYDQFVREMDQMGFNADQAQTLARKYLGIPNDVSTLITNPGMTTAYREASRYINLLHDIPDHISTTHTLRFVSAGIGPTSVNQALSSASYPYKDGGIVGYADGGLPRFPNGGMFRGAGGPRDDANLVAISDGEFITNARDTSRNRDALEAGNQGATLVAIGGNGMAGMASGGGTTPFVRHGDVLAAEWDALLRAGWQGRAGDEMEALYPPLRKLRNGYVRLDQATRGEWEALLAAGWQGRAGDKMEALYPPLDRLRGELEGISRPLSDRQRAAQELLGRVTSGGSFFEDFSFKGGSANVGRFNDSLAKGFYSSGGKFVRGDVASYLRSVVKGAPASRGGAAMVQNVNVNIPNYVGSRSEMIREIREVVRSQGNVVSKSLAGGGSRV